MDKDQCIAELKERINCLLTKNYKLVALLDEIDYLLTKNYKLVTLLDDIRRSMVIFKNDIDVAIRAQDHNKDCYIQDHNRTVEGK